MGWKSGFCLCVGFHLLATAAKGQATLTAEKKLEISAFAGLSFISPDYGQAHLGYDAGIDVTRFLTHFYLAPSLEVRGSLLREHTNKPGQRVISGGVKLQHRYHRFTPFVDVLVGAGVFHYASGGYEDVDYSIVYTAGGGTEFDLTPHFAIRGEVTTSHWNFGPDPTLGHDFTLMPLSVSGGLVYRIPFKPR